MYIHDYIVVAGLIVAIGYACYTDLTRGKISNKLSFGLLLFGLIYKGAYLAFGSMDVFNFLWLVIGSLLIVFMMFYIGVWAPGDSKLFWGISIIIPSKVLVTSSFDYTPVILLFNIFVPYFFFMMILILLKTSIQQKKIMLTRLVNRQFLIRLTLVAFVLIGLTTAIRKYSPIELSNFSIFVLLLLSYLILQKILPQNKIAFLVAPFSIFSLLWVYSDFIGFLLVWISVVFSFLLIRFLISLSNFLFVEEVDIANLQQGAIPGTLILRDSQGKYYMKDILEAGFFALASKNYEGELLVSMQPEGLAEEQISQLKMLSSKGLFKQFNNKIKIQKKQVFAPMILIGTLLTLLSQGLFTDFLYAQIQNFLC